VRAGGAYDDREEGVNNDRGGEIRGTETRQKKGRETEGRGDDRETTTMMAQGPAPTLPAEGDTATA
jgi:hypothetical protein